MRKLAPLQRPPGAPTGPQAARGLDSWGQAPPPRCCILTIATRWCTSRGGGPAPDGGYTAAARSRYTQPPPSSSSRISLHIQRPRAPIPPLHPSSAARGPTPAPPGQPQHPPSNMQTALAGQKVLCKAPRQQVAGRRQLRVQAYKVSACRGRRQRPGGCGPLQHALPCGTLAPAPPCVSLRTFAPLARRIGRPGGLASAAGTAARSRAVAGGRLIRCDAPRAHPAPRPVPLLNPRSPSSATARSGPARLAPTTTCWMPLMPTASRWVLAGRGCRGMSGAGAIQAVAQGAGLLGWSCQCCSLPPLLRQRRQQWQQPACVCMSCARR